MDFITVFGFDVKQGKAGTFQKWMAENEDKLAASAPDGWEYIGTYSAVMTSEKEAGTFRQLWRHDSYGAMDTWAATMREGGTFAELNDEFAREFIDVEKGSHWSQLILKAVSDTSYWGE